MRRCADSCCDGRNPAEFMLPEAELQRLTPRRLGFLSSPKTLWGSSEAPSATLVCSRTSPEVNTDTPSQTIRPRRRADLDVDYHVFQRARAANQNVSGRRRLERLGIILHRPGNQSALTGVANSGPAGPADRDVTSFGELQQALELGIPGDR